MKGIQAERSPLFRNLQYLNNQSSVLPDSILQLPFSDLSTHIKCLKKVTNRMLLKPNNPSQNWMLCECLILLREEVKKKARIFNSQADRKGGGAANGPDPK